MKPKPKPKVQVTTEVSAKVAEAIKANPATLQVRVSAGAQDGTTVIERPRRIEVVEVTAVDGEGRPSLGRRHDLATNEWTTVEFDQGYRRTGVRCNPRPTQRIDAEGLSGMEKFAETNAVASADEAESVIRAKIKACVDDISDREAEAIKLGGEWGIEESWIKERFAKARKEAAAKREAQKPKASLVAEAKWKRRGKWATPADPVVLKAEGFAEALNDAIAKPKAGPFFSAASPLPVVEPTQPEQAEANSEPSEAEHNTAQLPAVVSTPKLPVFWEDVL